MGPELPLSSASTFPLLPLYLHSHVKAYNLELHASKDQRPTIFLTTSGNLFRLSVPAHEPTPASTSLWHK